MFFKVFATLTMVVLAVSSFAENKAFTLGSHNYFIAMDGSIELNRFMQDSSTKDYCQPFRLILDEKVQIAFSGPIFKPGYSMSQQVEIKESNAEKSFVVDEGITLNSDSGYTRKAQSVLGGVLFDIKLRDGALRRQFTGVSSFWSFDHSIFAGKKVVWNDVDGSFPSSFEGTAFLSTTANGNPKTLRIELANGKQLGVVIVEGISNATFRNGVKSWFYGKGSLPLYRLDLDWDKGERFKYFVKIMEPSESLPSAEEIIKASEATIEVDNTITKGNLINQGSSFETGMYDGFTAYARPSFWTSTQPEVAQPVIDSTVAYEGKNSLQLTDNCRHVGLLFNPVQFKLHKPYTFSMYMKAEKPAKVRIATSYASHFGGVWSRRFGQDFGKLCDVTTEWQRFHITFTPKEFGLLGYWTFGAAVVDQVRDFPNTKVWIDAVQLEEGELTAYAPAKKLEMGATATKLYSMYTRNDEVKLNIFLRNNEKAAQNVNIKGRILDYWDAEVATISLDNIAVPAQDNLKKEVNFGKLKRGWYKALLAIDSGDEEEVLFSVYEPQKPIMVGPEWPFAIHEIYENSISRELGFGWSRIFFGFTLLNPNGENDFKTQDALVEMAQRKGIQLFPVMDPDFVKPGTTNANKPWFIEEFKDLGAGKPAPLIKKDVWEYSIYNYVKRYKDKIKYWEILNEPNTYLSPEVYVEYLEIAYNAAKKADPEAQIVGICSTSDMGGEALPWTRKVLELGGWKYLDVVAIHLYSSEKPEVNHSFGIDGIYAKIHEICAKYGKKVTIWNTEKNASANNSGYSRAKMNIPGNIYTYNKGRIMGTFRDRGENFIREGIISSCEGNGPFFWHCFLPNTLFLGYFTHGAYLANPNYYEFDLSPKPELIAVNGMTSLLYGREIPSGKLNWGSDYRCYLYSGKEGTLACVWNFKSKSTVSLDMKDVEFTLYDYFGEPISSKLADGKLDIMLESAPKYIVFPKLNTSEATEILKGVVFKDSSPIKVEASLISTKDKNIALQLDFVNSLDKEYKCSVDITSMPASWSSAKKNYELNITKQSQIIVPLNNVTSLSSVSEIKFSVDKQNYTLPIKPFKSIQELSNSLQTTDVVHATYKKSAELKFDGDLADWSDIPAVFINDGRGNQEWKNVLDCSSELKAIWNEDELIFGIRVWDDKVVANVDDITSLWANDSIELFLDLSTDDYKDDLNSDDSSYRLNSDDFHGTVAPAMFGKDSAVVRWKYLKSDANSRIVRKTLADGYSIELAVKWSELAKKFKFTPSEKAKIGFTFTINDEDSKDLSARKRLIWHGTQGVNRSPKSWGSMILESKKSTNSVKKTAINNNLRDAVECTPRSGLPNFLAKLKSGKKVTIAYFGGSITAQSGWRVQSEEYFKKIYPNAQIESINAAIGGTGSMLGVFRMDYDVLRFKPDLIFVEFAVNDAGTTEASLIKSFEGIINKTWTQYPDCDICFVYTFTEAIMGPLVDGKYPRAASYMERIADHYGIPTIHMGIEAVELFKAGKLEMKAPNVEMTKVSGDSLNQDAPIQSNKNGKIPFSNDGVHPYGNTGHRLYTAAIIRSMPKIEAVSKRVGNHTLPAPIDPKNLKNTAMVSPKELQLTGTWDDLTKDKNFKNLTHRIPALLCGKPGATLSFKFKGSQLALYDLLAYDSGKIRVEIDGIAKELTRLDAYCTYRRLSMTTAGNNLDPNKVHEVKITVLDDKVDKRSILFERNRADFDKNPDKYKETNWYVGAILLVGEIVK